MSEEADRQRWLAARHEAGHAVAAVHYGCPMQFVSIEVEWPALGTTRLAPELPTDAIVLYCGPLAEYDWDDFCPGAAFEFPMVGGDYESLQYLRQTCGSELREDACLTEAITFLAQPHIQQQVDRVAQALLERTRLTQAEVREIVGEL